VNTATWEALGTSVVVKVTDAAALGRARAVVEADLARVDAACSRFRPDSDLSKVNAAAGRRVAVDGLLIEALQLGLWAAAVTDGDVDPALGSALQLAGYDRDWRLLSKQTGVRSGPAGGGAPRATLALSARLAPGWTAIEIDRDAGTVAVPRGVSIDLGATAKAWAADRAASAVNAATGTGALVSLGGDIGTAGSAPRGGWMVHVTDDHRSAPDAPGQTVTIGSGGLATSSTTVRRWRCEGADNHHIIDPRTGAPARGRWRTVSVAGASCVDANVAATAAIVRGAGATAWLTELGLPARLVADDGTVQSIGGWPQDSVQRVGRRAA
jgi:thiamine biosynthesis lipoprotein